MIRIEKYDRVFLQAILFKLIQYFLNFDVEQCDLSMKCRKVIPDERCVRVIWRNFYIVRTMAQLLRQLGTNFGQLFFVETSSTLVSHCEVEDTEEVELIIQDCYGTSSEDDTVEDYSEMKKDLQQRKFLLKLLQVDSSF